jgi:hypothetical protein
MSEARVDSIDAIRNVRRALIKFAEVANTALTDADAEAVGTVRWLESEQRVHWASAVRKAQDLVSRCEEAVRQKRIFKDATGRTPSAVDEEKALAKAKRMLQHAEERFENVRRHTPRLQREVLLYKGQAQRLSTFVNGDIPGAIAKLDKMVASLEAYVNLAAPNAETVAPMNLPADSVEAVKSDSAEPQQQATEPPKSGGEG